MNYHLSRQEFQENESFMNELREIVEMRTFRAALDVLRGESPENYLSFKTASAINMAQVIGYMECFNNIVSLSQPQIQTNQSDDIVGLSEDELSQPQNRFTTIN